MKQGHDVNSLQIEWYPYHNLNKPKKDSSDGVWMQDWEIMEISEIMKTNLKNYSTFNMYDYLSTH